MNDRVTAEALLDWSSGALEEIERDLLRDLQRLPDGDRAARRALEETRLSIDLLHGDLDAAEATIARVAALHEKRGPRLAAGLMARSFIAARRAVPGRGIDARVAQAFRADLASRLESLPIDSIVDEVRAAKAHVELSTQAIVLGTIEMHLVPAANAAGMLLPPQARQLVSMRRYLETELPLREEISTVCGQALRRAASVLIGISPELLVSTDAGLSEVTIGIWDTGTDVSALSAGCHAAPGIAFDVDWKPSDELLMPLPPAVSASKLMRAMKGYFDVRVAHDSEEAAQLLARTATIAPRDVPALLEEMALATVYAHGTSVADRALEGNPFARLCVARFTPDTRPAAAIPTLTRARLEAQAYRRTVDHFRRHGVRVVNMSWTVRFKTIESLLGRDSVLAERIFEILRRGMESAMHAAPEILFVAAAGNFDDDLRYRRTIPAMLDLPNLIIVGATNAAGEPAGFTSYGDDVDLYACGSEVDTVVPGGLRIALSGSSIAAPAVSNLAARLFALRPELTAVEAAVLMLAAADRAKGIPIVHPMRTAAIARHARAFHEEPRPFSHPSAANA